MTPEHSQPTPSMPSNEQDEYWMAKALRLAEQGLTTTSPNPRVGCIIVKDGIEVGRGWHQQAGQPHAEVHALRAAGDQAKDATAYVTLEPCSHFGRTPPCAQALIAAGVARVVGATGDANPEVSGRGFQQLRDAGISVTEGCLEAQARALNAGFFKRMTHGLPWVRVKLAHSLDGRTAMASGESQWITGPAARQDVQRLRARSCAVITGADSVLHDNPSMNVRFHELTPSVPEALQRQPLRVVIDGQQRVPHDARLLSLPGDLWFAGHQDQYALPERDTSLGDTRYWHAAATPQGRTDLLALLQALGEQGCNEVLVETGANLAGAFISAGLVDELVLYCAPTLLGDRARPLLSLPLDTMAQQQRWHWQDVRMVGNDLRLTLTPAPQPESTQRPQQ